MTYEANLVVSGANDSCLKSWWVAPDTTPTATSCLSTIVAHTQPVYDLVVSGRLLVSASYDRSIKVSFWESE